MGVRMASGHQDSEMEETVLVVNPHSKTEWLLLTGYGMPLGKDGLAVEVAIKSQYILQGENKDTVLLSLMPGIVIPVMKLWNLNIQADFPITPARQYESKGIVTLSVQV
jgi:hypothetical protein